MKAVYIENNAYNILILEDLDVHYDLSDEDVKDLFENKDVSDWSFTKKELIYDDDMSFEKIIEEAIEAGDKVVELEVKY